jgi:hypothetical protein
MQLDNPLSSARLALAGSALLAVLALLGACASYQPQPLSFPEQLTDMQEKRSGDVGVAVGILSDEQAAQHFGIDLGAKDIQAIWLEIRNASNIKLWFIRNALDPDFYSADEVIAVAGSSVPDSERAQALQNIRDASIRVMLPPKTDTEGFIFTPKAIGGRYVDVRLLEDAYSVQLEREQAAARGESIPEAGVYDLRFGFAMPLPDGLFDYERLHPEKTYPGLELPNLSEEEFRAALEALPCCARNKAGTEDGDPLNLVIVGPSGAALNSLSRAGWSFTHRITFESVRRLTGAALLGETYPVAPVSNLYLFDRSQDFALQRARANISQRNHMRVWLAPFRFRNLPVWVGQVSRDIGIKVTPESPTLTTHIIDPEVDLTREYLLHSLLAEGFVDTFGFVAGARFATREAPASNLTGDPYFSDGERLVVLLSPDPVPYSQVKSFLWDRSAAPVAEGQSEAARENVRSLDTQE